MRMITVIKPIFKAVINLSNPCPYICDLQFLQVTSVVISLSVVAVSFLFSDCLLCAFEHTLCKISFTISLA